MTPYILNTGALGNTFSEVAKKAKEIAIRKTPLVEFDFNGIRCLVDKDTDLGLLWRDYANAHRMDWKEVGPACVKEYDAETKAELNRRKEISEEKQRLQDLEYRAKDDKERATYEERTKGIVIELSNIELWNSCKEKNADPYGKCCVDYAESWAKLMQAEMASGKTVIECAEKTSFELGFYGITGFMYGAAVSMLSQCWKHGEQLRKWHNKEYNHEGDGVVNPAIFTINA